MDYNKNIFLCKTKLYNRYMNIILNERQQKIFNDLKETKTPITAKTLAIKYNVSLRTIRNDINDITLFLNDINGKIIKVPKIGIRIIDAGNNNLSGFTQASASLSNFAYFDNYRQLFAVFTYFVVNKNPITSDECSELFMISKGTFLSRVKDLNRFLEKTNVHLGGIRNKGFYLECDKKGFLESYELFRTKIRSNGIYDILFNNDELIDPTTKLELSNILRFIENDLSLTVQHYRTLCNLLGCFIKIKRRNVERYRNYINLEHHDKSYAISQYFLVVLKIILTDNDLTMIDYLLDKCTDLNEGEIKHDTYHLLGEATDALLKTAIKLEPELASDFDNLKIDIIKHIQSTIARKNLNINNTNPLLNQIKARFPVLFNIVKNSIPSFEKIYPLNFSDDEIGYITLYFRRSIEKTEKIKDARVIVICNTGRGASKLLATRIMNNLPEIHIMAILSSDELDSMEDFLDNIDLIISTMRLDNIKKPYIIVSPFLSDDELQMIKEAVFIGRDSHSSLSKNSLNELASSLISQYVASDKANEFTNKIFYLTNDRNIKQSNSLDLEAISEVAVEIMEMCKELYPNGLKNSDFNRISGIFAHVFMSLSRWLASDFIKVYDYEELQTKYHDQYIIIEKFIDRMEKKLNITIDRVEIIAILRYII